MITVVHVRASVLDLCVLFDWSWVVDAVEIRNRMRSVDDLVHYGRWKRESLGARRHNDAKTGGDGGADVSLNQSFSCASTAATDDEGRPGPSHRKRRTLRLRRRSTRGLYSSESSIVSAPVTRHINLDESVGSAALDVDSMFRFFALSTPVADDGVGGPAAKTKGPSSSGLPPSGAAGRTASAPRPTSLRRRRRPKSSLTNGCVDPSSFDDVQMTSSSVDLKDVATAEVAAAPAEPESFGGVERSKSVGRSPRRRRTSGEPPSSPSSTDGQDSADAALPAMSMSATDVVVKPEALWELCGEKLNELCRRILDVGVTDDVVTEVTSPQNMTESAHADVKDVKPTNVVDASPPRIDTSPQSERRRQTNNVCLTLLVIPDKSSDQPTPQSSDPTDRKEDNWNDVENNLTDVGSIVMGRQNDEDDDFRRDHTSPTVTADDVHSHTSSVQTAASHVPPLDVEHHVEQFQTETTLPEHCLQPEEAALPDQLRTVRAPLTISDNDAVHVGDVSDHGDGSAIVHERRGLPGLDINAMLSPSIDLQDILDTIYTLTGGVGRENDANDEDGTQPLSLHDLSPAGNAAHGDENDGHSHLLDDNDIVQLSEHAAAVCLERAGDDDESLLDFDAEMYGYDLSPVAADFADSVRLAIAEDVDDDLDIADDEYDLDDGDVL